MKNIQQFHKLIIFSMFVLASEQMVAISQNLLQIRPFSSYKAAELVAYQETFGHDERDQMFSFFADYMQSFGDSEGRVSSHAFWSGNNTMTIGNNDGKSDIDAYQFGLGETTATGSITMNTQIQHVGGTFLLNLGRDKHKRAGYFQAKLPIGSTIVEHDICESEALLDDSEDAWFRYPVQEVRFGTLREAFVSGTETREPDLKFGRLCDDRSSVVRIGDLEFVLGYNFVGREDMSFGAGFKVSCPTGNVPNAEYLLEPVFGRAGHWGFGGELYGNWERCSDHDVTYSVGFKGDVLHLTSGRQPHMRTFDLAANGPGSKYMLLQRYMPVLVNGAGARIPGEIVPASTITTIPVNSEFSVEGSMAVRFRARKDNCHMSLIGEFWGRARESLSLNCKQLDMLQEHNLNDFAVLGRQVGQIDTMADALNYCEPLARINKAVARQTTAVNSDPDNVKDASLAANRINASYEQALDICGQEAVRAFTGKVALEMGYKWCDNAYQPGLSLTGGVEFANDESNLPSLWSVGLQGYMSF